MLSEAFFGCQRHKNIVNYTIFTRGQYQKIMKNWPKIDQKTPNKDLQNSSSNFTLFFPTPNPQKRENPSRLKDFRGGSAAGARPRVAKAMLSCHHYTARHRRIMRLTPDSRAPAKADPSARAGVGVGVGVGVGGVVVVVVVVLFLLLLLLLTDVGPIWAQVCPCLGPRLLLLWLLLLSLSSLFFFFVVVCLFVCCCCCCCCGCCCCCIWAQVCPCLGPRLWWWLLLLLLLADVGPI